MNAQDTGRAQRTGVGIWLLLLAFLAEAVLLFFSKIEIRMLALVHIAAFSVFAFVAFAWDKFKAVRGSRRISEGTLFTISILGGALGGLAAMVTTRHKTQRMLFWVVLCAALFMHIVVVGWLFVSR